MEIGTGQGALTQELLQTTVKLQMVELDRDLIGMLAQLCNPFDDLVIPNADALKFDFTILANPEYPLWVVSNPPYN